MSLWGVWLLMTTKLNRSGSGSGSSCGACKFLRRKCTCDCVFAPYFSYDQASTHFAAVHKVFGASNISKLLLHLPEQARSDAAVTISYEALARMRDPVYGCVGHIFALQEQVANLQEEIEMLGNQMANIGVGFQSSRRDDQFHDRNIFNDVGLQHFQETNHNNENDKSVMFFQNTAEHPLLFQTQSEASDMMMSTEFDGMYENDPNLMDMIFEGTETVTCTPSYPWILNNV